MDIFGLLLKELKDPAKLRRFGLLLKELKDPAKLRRPLGGLKLGGNADDQAR